MKLSALPKERLSTLTDEQIFQIIYGNCVDDCVSADVALLLGSRPEICIGRAEAAARLYLEGRVPYVVPTGGVEWDYENERISEASLMTRILLERGVPAEAIILENEARTTKENMLYGVIQINRRLKLQNVKTLCVVTSARHMRRSLALAHWLLPRSVEICGYPANLVAEKEMLTVGSEGIGCARHEVELMKGLIDSGLIEDIEY